MVSLRSTKEFDPTYRFTTSWILSPAALFFVRALLSTYAFVTIFFILGYDGTHGGKAGQTFSYFTSLTYWGLAFYYLFAALHTGWYWQKGKPLLANWPRPLQEAHSAFYTTITVFPFLVTIVFWVLLFGPNGKFTNSFDSWSNISQHGLNSAYALFEIIFPRTEPQPWLHSIILVFLLALYLGLAYLTHATQGFYVYPFLNIQKNGSGLTAAYIVGILVGTLIVFIIVRYIIWLRVWVTEKKMGKTGKFGRYHNVDERNAHGAAVQKEGGIHMNSLPGSSAHGSKNAADGSIV